MSLLNQVWLKRGEGKDIAGRGGLIDQGRIYRQGLLNLNWWSTVVMPQRHCLCHLFCITGGAKASINHEIWSLTIKHCNIIAIYKVSLLWTHILDKNIAKHHTQMWALFKPKGGKLRTYTTLHSNHNLMPMQVTTSHMCAYPCLLYTCKSHNTIHNNMDV